jgi:hypothetical protein
MRYMQIITIFYLLLHSTLAAAKTQAQDPVITNAQEARDDAMDGSGRATTSVVAAHERKPAFAIPPGQITHRVESELNGVAAEAQNAVDHAVESTKEHGEDIAEVAGAAGKGALDGILEAARKGEIRSPKDAVKAALLQAAKEATEEIIEQTVEKVTAPEQAPVSAEGEAGQKKSENAPAPPVTEPDKSKSNKSKPGKSKSSKSKPKSGKSKGKSETKDHGGHERIDRPGETDLHKEWVERVA